MSCYQSLSTTDIVDALPQPCSVALLVGVGAAAGVPNTMAITNTYMTLTGTVNGMFSTVSKCFYTSARLA
jgi:hypothetical protein